MRLVLQLKANRMGLLHYNRISPLEDHKCITTWIKRWHCRRCVMLEGLNERQELVEGKECLIFDEYLKVYIIGSRKRNSRKRDNSIE